MAILLTESAADRVRSHLAMRGRGRWPSRRDQENRVFGVCLCRQLCR